MLDPMTSLAFSVYSGKGVHALLLGSGISRSSGIMTGWEIVLDLIRKFSAVEGEDCGDKPDEWYRAKYHKEPDYSELLKRLANSSAERMNLLRAYFEADDGDREAGKKEPTAAHHAIARLVADGYIRVIVTTNFDRLMERALEAAGVVPSIIASPNSILGAAPLAQSRCTVIKVHGDYLDTRLKNTPEELAKYVPPLKRLLRQVFDEYGLIVCGWSAEWDTALKAAIEGCPNRRYTMYWSAFRGVAQDAAGLCQKRDAQVIKDMGADQFFTALADKVAVLKEMDAPHPVTKTIAVAALKKYIADDRDRIRLHDLVMIETNKAAKALFADATGFRRVPNLKEYESNLEILLPLMAAAGYWGRAAQRRLWLEAFQRMTSPRNGQTRYFSAQLDYYPAYLMLYAFGIGALASGRHSNVAFVISRTRVVEDHRGNEILLINQATTALRRSELQRAIENHDNSYRQINLVVSRYIGNLLKSVLSDWVGHGTRYEELVASFEYITGLVTSDYYEKLYNNGFGTFDGYHLYHRSIGRRFQEDMDKKVDRLAYIRAGLFDGSLQRLREVKAGFEKASDRQRMLLHIHLAN